MYIFISEVASKILMVIHLQKEPEPLSLVKLHIFRIKKSPTHDKKKHDGREQS